MAFAGPSSNAPGAAFSTRILSLMTLFRRLGVQAVFCPAGTSRMTGIAEGVLTTIVPHGPTAATAEHSLMLRQGQEAPLLLTHRLLLLTGLALGEVVFT